MEKENSTPPLIIYGRCSAVEKACRAIGFEADSGQDLVARLVARAAGEGALVRSISAIATDGDVAKSYSYVRRCINELEEVGILTVSRTEGPPTRRRRGRPEVLLILQLDWNFINETNAISEKFFKHLKGGVIEPSDLMTDECRKGVETVSSECRDSVVGVSDGCRRSKHTLYPPITHLPCPQTPEDRRQEDSVEEEVHGSAIFVEVDSTVVTARRLFDGLDYRGNNGSTLWLVSAAYDAGLLSDNDIRPCVRRAYEKADTVEGRVGYFRNTLKDRLGLSSEQMKLFLGRIRFDCETPSSYPIVSSHRVVKVAARQVPAEPTTQDARVRVLAELQVIRD